MLNQSSHDVEYAAGSMHVRGRTIVFGCIDEHGPVTIAVTVDEEVLASDIARVAGGLALLAGDHAELAELLAEHGRLGHDTTGTFATHVRRQPTALVPLHPSRAVPVDLLRTPAERATDRLPQLPPRTSRPAIEYRDVPVAHHGGQDTGPGRLVVSGTWRYAAPEVCADDRRTGVWIGPPDRRTEQVFVCVSCGLVGI